MFHYDPGMRVEIIGHEDGYMNAYYAATEVRSNQHNVLVTYEERIDDDGQHLEEEVDVEHIRSYPPVVEHYLNVGDNVDVFSRDGWWRGKVILERETDLVVYFSELPRNRRHVTYERDHVRIHQEWFDVGCHSSWIHLKQSALATNHHHLQTAQDRHNQGTSSMHLLLIFSPPPPPTHTHYECGTMYTFQVGDRIEVIRHEPRFKNSFLQPLCYVFMKTDCFSGTTP
ncbi:hypothetical protein LXL04_003802 [Taraxacum kok-saghyz]